MEQIQTLLNSKKDESELTMCTDVDRNDKSRICKPGSVQVHPPAPLPAARQLTVCRFSLCPSR